MRPSGLRKIVGWLDMIGCARGRERGRHVALAFLDRIISEGGTMGNNWVEIARTNLSACIRR